LYLQFQYLSFNSRSFLASRKCQSNNSAKHKIYPVFYHSLAGSLRSAGLVCRFSYLPGVGVQDDLVPYDAGNFRQHYYKPKFLPNIPQSAWSSPVIDIGLISIIIS
jgi:hypothetical protein